MSDIKQVRKLKPSAVGKGMAKKAAKHLMTRQEKLKAAMRKQGIR